MKPIPQSLLDRLEALTGTGGKWEPSVKRPDEWQSQGAIGPVWTGIREPGAPHRLVWSVRLVLRAEPANIRAMIDEVAVELADALEAAVRRAEARGG
jgi:hypothetical protein